MLLSMRQFGGHFAFKLAEAAIAADPVNRAKILKTFEFIENDYGPETAFYSEELG